MDIKETVIEKVRTYRNLVQKSFPVTFDRCYLFGSYAKGTPHEYGDIKLVLNSRIKK